MNRRKEMRRGYQFKTPNAFALMLVVMSLLCTLLMLISMLKAPDPINNNLNTTTTLLDVNDSYSLGPFGNMMIGMLPQHLAFTVFVPSQAAFRRDLRLNGNHSLAGEAAALMNDDDNDDTYAVISRVLGFSAVPRILDSATLHAGEEVSYDSLSGFTLFVSKDARGVLMVNGVKSEKVDVRRGKLLVHVMDGVIMDAEFEQSVQPDFDARR